MKGTKEQLNEALLAKYNTRKRDVNAFYEPGEYYFLSDGASYMELLAGMQPGTGQVYHLKVVKNELPHASIELKLETVTVEII